MSIPKAKLSVVVSVGAGVALCAAGALGVTVGGAVAGNRGGHLAAHLSAHLTTAPPGPSSRAGATTTPTATGSVVPTTTSSARITSAIGARRRLLSSGEVTGVTRLSAVETTWSAYAAAADEGVDEGVHQSASLQVAPSDPVWIAVASGRYAPEFAGGESFSWGAIVYDAASGAPLGSIAGPGGWPPWLATLPPVTSHG